MVKRCKSMYIFKQNYIFLNKINIFENLHLLFSNKYFLQRLSFKIGCRFYLSLAPQRLHFMKSKLGEFVYIFHVVTRRKIYSLHVNIAARALLISLMFRPRKFILIKLTTTTRISAV